MRTIALTYMPFLTRTMAALAALVALCVLLYGIFLLEAVGNTARRTAAERQIRNVTSQVSSLEQAYLSHTKGMTLEKAMSLGFTPPARVTTVFATAQAQPLSFGR